MSWKYEEGAYTHDSKDFLCFWVNKAKCAVALDWRVCQNKEVYGMDSMHIKIEDHLDALSEGKLGEDIQGFLDNLRDVFINQIKLKKEEESQQKSEEIPSNT
jgi:C4-type Zn-finger protein